MSENYIPRTDAGFRNWAIAFASGITANPALYMLTSAQALSIQNAVDDFLAAYDVIQVPATTTKNTIILKDNARNIAETLCRQYAMLIKSNAGISDDDKVNIGVRPINPNREVIDCPQTSPIMTVIANTPGSQTVQYADPTEPLLRKKPFGASELQLFRAIGTEENLPLTDAQFYGKFTRTPIAVEFNEEDNGKIATYYARWASVRGETGPWSLPVSMAIAA